MQVTEDRKKRVIDLYFNRHKTYAEIAEIEHVSPRDIHAIIKEEETRRQNYKDQQRQEEVSSKAHGRLYILNSIYRETNGKLGPFLKIYKQLIKERGMSIEQVANAVDIAANKLPYMESLYGQVKE